MCFISILRALHISKNEDTASDHEASSESTKRQGDGGGWNLYSWESEITSLISIKECKDFSPPLVVCFFNRGRHVTAGLLSPLFHLLYSPPFFPSQRTLSSVSISLCILLLLHATRAQLLAQHILGESSPFLNSLHSFKLTHTDARDGRWCHLIEKLLA